MESDLMEFFEPVISMLRFMGHHKLGNDLTELIVFARCHKINKPSELNEYIRKELDGILDETNQYEEFGE